MEAKIWIFKTTITEQTHSTQLRSFIYRQSMFDDLTIMLISKITRRSFGEASRIWNLSPVRNWENEIFKKKFDLKDECGAEWKVLFRLKGVIVNFVIYYVAPISAGTKKKIQSYLTGFFLNGNLTLETQKKHIATNITNKIYHHHTYVTSCFPEIRFISRSSSCVDFPHFCLKGARNRVEKVFRNCLR